MGRGSTCGLQSGQSEEERGGFGPDLCMRASGAHRPIVYAHFLIGCESNPASVANISASISIEMQVMPRSWFVRGDAIPATNFAMAQGFSESGVQSISLRTPKMHAMTILVKLAHHALHCQGKGSAVEIHQPS